MIKPALCASVIFSSIFMFSGRHALAAAAQPASAGNDTNIVRNTGRYMRIARIVVDSAQLKEYYAALREGMEMAVRREPGVLNLWAVADKNNPSHITVFEIYADMEAYHAHTQTAHFRKYKATVQNMVKSLELVDVDPVALESKGKF